MVVCVCGVEDNLALDHGFEVAESSLSEGRVLFSGEICHHHHLLHILRVILSSTSPSSTVVFRVSMRGTVGPPCPCWVWWLGYFFDFVGVVGCWLGVFFWYFVLLG